MEKTTLKRTDLTVSRVCFGTMTFGSQVDQACAEAIVNRCLDAGVNFFDTANIYNKGTSEVMLGRALGQKRNGIVLASKVFGKMGDTPNESGLSRTAILRAVEASLKRLGTDYLDIYYMHQPDYSVPMEESLEAMDRLVRDGKVLYPASSNYSSWQITRMLWIAETSGYAAPYISQPMYNLLARGIEQEFLPMAKE
ncbi:MAG: aldo/keto reductase, partial [Bryobacteraceae bacterium]|nr:aldo/keto reductase [Bryobacteraceae bacterium]